MYNKSNNIQWERIAYRIKSIETTDHKELVSKWFETKYSTAPY